MKNLNLNEMNILEMNVREMEKYNGGSGMPDFIAIPLYYLYIKPLSIISKLLLGK